MVLSKLKIFLLASAYLGLWTTTIHTEASDSLKPGDQMGSSTQLCSAKKRFCMAFVQMTEDSGRIYLVIFENTYPGRIYFVIFENIDPRLEVWIGNTNEPLFNNAGTLTLDDSGVLKIIINQGREPINLYSPPQAINNTKATLLDTGNFVLQEINQDGSMKSVLWQSFDYPVRTLIPEMKLGVNHKTGHKWSLVSHLTDSIPASGSFTLEWEPRRGELIIKRRGQVYWASGVLINNKFENVPEQAQGMYEYTIVSNEDEEYFSFTAPNEDYAKWILYASGQLVDGRGNHIARADLCYGYNTDGGCQRWELPSCRHAAEIFDVRSGNLRNLDLLNLRLNLSTSLSVSDCKAICWSNCSCLGFTNYYSNGTGCVFYNGKSWANIPDAGADSFYMLVSTYPEHHGESTLHCPELDALTLM